MAGNRPMPNPDPALFASHQALVPLASIQGRHFTIVGCGALGTILGRILARLGAHRFHLIDGERVELRHLNREVFSHEQIGENKAAALAAQLTSIHPKVRAVTTAKRFAPEFLTAGKEDVLVLSTSDVNMPQTVIDALAAWPRKERPTIFVTRHSGLIGGYWMADLAHDDVTSVPTDLRWLAPTGQDATDAQSRIATTAHVVAGVTAQAIADHVCARNVQRHVDIDMRALVRAG